MSVLFAEGPDDPRIFDVDDDFRNILIELSALTVASATRRDRFFHATGTSLGGTLRIAPSAELPVQEFFRPGREFPVLARFSNSVGTDDVSPTVRGLTLRLLDDPAGTSGLMDLTFNTGECFFAPTAEIFQRAFASPEERRALVERQPRTRDVIWDNIRRAAPYETYDFHTQVPQAFRTEDGVTRLARYRVRPALRPVEAPRYEYGDELWPPDAPQEIGRPAKDTRPDAVLREEAQVQAAGVGIRLSLQVQLRDPEQDSAAFDASRPWPQDKYPWLDLGEISLDRAVDQEAVGRLRFDPALAPDGLGIALSRSPRSTASVNHLRALIYRAAAHARREERAPAELTALTRPTRTRRGRSVCVIGAGPAGLTAAYELERAGHRVTVLESASSVAGKCASIEADGLPFDLGGHICTSRYTHTAALITELGLATEPITPINVLDGASGEVSGQDTAFFRRDVYQRYTRLRDREFPRIAEPGLAHSAAALAEPLSVWLDRHDLWSLAETFGLGYTAAGYGYLADDPAALYFVKYVEMTGLLTGDEHLLGHAGAFTVSGGFARLWRTLAERLADVRLGVTVRSVERRGDSVVVSTEGAEIEVDDLVLAIPLDDALPFLDATDDERDLAARVAYQAYDTVVVSAIGLPRFGFYFAKDHADDPAQRGHSVALHHRHEPSDVYTAYTYRDAEHDNDTLDEMLRHDVTRLGGTPGQVHLRRSWRFMPHFDAQDVQAGVLERLEAMQGVGHTYYVGGLVGFELVECVVAQARALVARHFEEDRTAAAILRWMTDRIATELGLDARRIDEHTPLADLGLDSLTVATLQAQLSARLGFRIPHTLFLEQPSLAAAARELADAAGDVASPTPDMPRAAAPYLLALTPPRPFFCVGGLGSSARYLRHLAHALGPHTPFYALELPGLGGGDVRTAVLDDAEVIAKLFAEEIRRVQPHGPYRLGGHSSGGLLAYETARRLRDAGEHVDPLLLFDAYTPLDDVPPPAEDDLVALEEMLLLRHLWCTPERGCDCAVDRERPLEEQGPEIAATLGAPDPERAEEFLLRALEVYQAGLRAVTGYRPPPSDLDLVLVKPADGFGTEATLQPRRLLHLEAQANGWEKVGARSLALVPVSGGHVSMLLRPHVDAVRAAAFDTWSRRGPLEEK
ncbi:MAG TPA: thioesterase domain-containing protein [Actinospica sp.]|jgi:thioesterase domain-containing protein/predicted NAD/FAD-dependent oxidoreductase/acyl carrier protein|nr:thioesterase domain-containing protein [Actinospica sp.]